LYVIDEDAGVAAVIDPRFDIDARRQRAACFAID
jgi:hypothetical protein